MPKEIEEEEFKAMVWKKKMAVLEKRKANLERLLHERIGMHLAPFTRHSIAEYVGDVDNTH